MDNTLISVVIPVYNVEKYLDRCVQSVVSQTYTHLDIILVDDGSPDKSSSMCDIWQEKDSRIRVIHKENGGLTSARKAGFDIANSEYVLFIDSDDYIELNMVELLVNKALDTNYDMTLCSYSYDSSSINPVKMSYTKDLTTKEEIRDLFIFPIIRPMKNDVSTNGFMVTKLIRKSIITDDLFVSEREYYTEDVIFNINLALKVNGIGIVNEPLYHYCENSDSLTKKYRENKYEIWNKRTDYFKRFFEINNWTEITKDRVVVLDLVALLVAVDNEILNKDYKSFKKKCEYARKVTKKRGNFALSNLKKLSSSTTILVAFLVMFRMYSLLYLFRKKRIGV